MVPVGLRIVSLSSVMIIDYWLRVMVTCMVLVFCIILIVICCFAALIRQRQSPLAPLSWTIDQTNAAPVRHDTHNQQSLITMPNVPSSVETNTVQINMMVDSSTAGSEWSGPPLTKTLAYLAIPFLLVTPLVTSILQIVLASETIAKYTNTNDTMHHFDGTDSAKGFSMIHDGNIFISASYPIVLCVFGCGYFVLLASAIGQRDDSVAVRCGTLLLFSTLTVPSISTIVVFVMTAPIAPEFYSSDLHVARMLALVTSSIKLFFITFLFCASFCWFGCPWLVAVASVCSAASGYNNCWAASRRCKGAYKIMYCCRVKI